MGCMLALAITEAGTRAILPTGNWTPEMGLGPAAYEIGRHQLLRTKRNLDTHTCANLNPWTELLTDSRGFRIPRDHPEAPKGAEKVVVLGASNTWGMGVRAEDSWPFALQRELADRGRDIEVMNAAQVGYTLPHMFLRARELADNISVDRILIAVPSSGLYMFGFGSRADDWRFENYHPWHVTTTALEFPFDDLPDLEAVNGSVLWKDRPFRGTLLDDAVTLSANAHRIWVKTLMRLQRFTVVLEDRQLDLQALKKQAADLGGAFTQLEDYLAVRGIGLHLVFFPAEWEDLKLREDERSTAILSAFQRVARVGLRRFPRADLRADPAFRVELDLRPGHDLLIDRRHLSPSGHAKVAASLADWYVAKKLGVK